MRVFGHVRVGYALLGARDIATELNTLSWGERRAVPTDPTLVSGMVSLLLTVTGGYISTLTGRMYSAVGVYWRVPSEL